MVLVNIYKQGQRSCTHENEPLVGPYMASVEPNTEGCKGESNKVLPFESIW